MQITNQHNLPQAIVDFLSRKYYVPGESDFSVTGLLTPPQILQLKKRYDEYIIEDAMDQIWSVFGTAVHELFDKYENSGAETELRLYHTYYGVKVGGQVDHYHNGTITDYKVTSVWSIIYDSRKEEWAKQQNIYADIFRKNGYPVNKLQICAILRDWSESKAQQDSSYPQTPVVILDLPLWETEQVESFVKGLVTEHTAAFKLDDDQLPPCSAEDMWEKPTTYAVMKKGNKRATKVCDSKEAAEEYCQTNGLTVCAVIEVRQGERVRCERYCSVKQFCHQYKDYVDGRN